MNELTVECLRGPLDGARVKERLIDASGHYRGSGVEDRVPVYAASMIAYGDGTARIVLMFREWERIANRSAVQQ